MDKELEAISRAREIQLAGHVLYPMLQGRRESSISQIVSLYRGGEDVNKIMLAVARLAEIESFIQEIRQVEERGNKLMQRSQG